MRNKVSRVCVGIDPTVAAVAKRCHCNFSKILESALMRQLGLQKQIVHDISHQNRFDGIYPMPSQKKQRECIIVRSMYHAPKPLPMHSGGRFYNIRADDYMS